MSRSIRTLARNLRDRDPHTLACTGAVGLILLGLAVIALSLALATPEACTELAYRVK